LQLDTGVGREIVIEKQRPDQAHEFREGEVPIVLMERSSGSIVRITPNQGIEVISPTPPPTPLPLVPFTPGREELLYPLPAPVPITSGFGMRTHPISGTMEFHQGVDLGAPLGTPILAAFSGQVVQAGVSGGLGKVVSLDHGNKRTRYGHMEKINVAMGETVSQGSVVGYVGSTGLSTGPHLHFELWQQAPTGGWVALDSADLLKVAMAQVPS
jgi:murein DD-endopeptidase MepM/ murein hydrolase activator NlpD